MNTYKAILLATVLSGAPLAAWEERPPDFKEQDRIFKNCQKLFEADKYEQSYLEQRDKEHAEAAQKSRQERIRSKMLAKKKKVKNEAN
jgi:hypothetical protein